MAGFMIYLVVACGFFYRTHERTSGSPIAMVFGSMLWPFVWGAHLANINIDDLKDDKERSE